MSSIRHSGLHAYMHPVLFRERRGYLLGYLTAQQHVRCSEVVYSTASYVSDYFGIVKKCISSDSCCYKGRLAM